MKTITKMFTALGLAVALFAAPAHASGGGQKNAEDYDFSFEGPFGKFDRAQLQRGCGEEDRRGIRDLRRGQRRNEQAAKAANNNALPPDLSLIVKAREGWYYPWYSSPFIKLFKGNGGAEYVRSLISGYEDPPHGEEKEGLNYNPYFPGHWIAMPPPLAGEDVEYADGTKPTLIQEATDVAAFLAWASMPKMEERKRVGLMTLLYLGVFALLMLMVKKSLWSRVEH